MPLAELDAEVKVPIALCPVIVVNGKRLHALAHDAAPLPAKAFRRPIVHVTAQSSALGSAIPTSSAAEITMRRAMKRGSSPAAIIRAR